MIYGSVCSGIEAATTAWHPLGWRPAFFSEIAPFPRAILSHHFPNTPLHSDFTTIKKDQYGTIKLLVGGTPCQSFSIAGLRKGMDSDNGNLALEFLKLAQSSGAEWLVWENVPGVLSSNKGRDFGALLGGLAELGFGFAWRILDAQYFGVAQRRRRVFLIAHVGGWRYPSAVLFERESLRRDNPPGRGEEQGITPDIAKSIRGNSGGIDREDMHTILPVLSSGQANAEISNDLAPSLNCNRDGAPIAFQSNARGDDAVYAGDDIAPSLRGGGDGGNPPAITVEPMSFDTTQITHPENRSQPAPGAPCHTLAKDGHPPGVVLGDQALFSIMPMNSGKDYRAREVEVSQPIMAKGPAGGAQGGDYVARSTTVRRLTPIECERLQGFPDGYTAITWRGKSPENCPDSPRYRALGNSMAVPVMRWIGERINMVENIINGEQPEGN